MSQTTTRTGGRIPDGELIEELQRLADELGEAPGKSQMNERGAYSAKTYQNRFGSWNAAVEAAGLEPNPVYKAVTRRELIVELQRVADELGKTPTYSEMRERGNYGTSAYENRFGGWTDAVEAAGLKPQSRGSLTDGQLLAELRRLADELGKTPTTSEMDEHGTYSAPTYSNRFDGWNNAIKAAGLTPDK
jgi:hypothetical protein